MNKAQNKSRMSLHALLCMPRVFGSASDGITTNGIGEWTKSLLAGFYLPYRPAVALDPGVKMRFDKNGTSDRK